MQDASIVLCYALSLKTLLRKTYFLFFFVACQFALENRAVGQDAEKVRANELPSTQQSLLKLLPQLSAMQHPWGRFSVGSWTETCTIVQSFEEDKLLRSTTQLRTTLSNIDEYSVSLEQKGHVEIGSKRVDVRTQTRQYDFLQQPISESTTIVLLPDANVDIAGEAVPCKVIRYETVASPTKQQTTLYYSPVFFPYLIQVEHTKISLPSGNEKEERVLSHSHTLLQDVPSLPSSNNKLGIFRLKTVKTTGTVKTLTISYCSKLVPGGVVMETVTETNKNGLPVRQTRSDVIQYSVAAGIVMRPEVLEFDTPNSRRKGNR